MSKYFGDIAEDATIEIPFNTYNSSGASVTFTGTTVKVYKDSATGTEVTTGVTLSKDHDGITGAHLVTIITTNAFYVTGSDYLVELQAATIDSQTVNSFIGSFSIENRFMRGTDNAALASTIGTPANIDGGGATIADNLKKIADDAGGATFDATTDSLEKISGAITAGGGTPHIE